MDPYPDDGLYEPAVTAFVMFVHKRGRGNCGNKLMALSTIANMEGQLRSIAYRKCKWSDARNKRDWCTRYLGRKNVKKVTQAQLALKVMHGRSIQEPRTTKLPLYSHDIDYCHQMLQKVSDDVERALLADAVLALHAMTAMRISTIHENKKREKDPSAPTMVWHLSLRLNR